VADLSAFNNGLEIQSTPAIGRDEAQEPRCFVSKVLVWIC
jgi:hypothetical protein